MALSYKFHLQLHRRKINSEFKIKVTSPSTQSGCVKCRSFCLEANIHCGIGKYRENCGVAFFLLDCLECDAVHGISLAGIAQYWLIEIWRESNVFLSMYFVRSFVIEYGLRNEMVRMNSQYLDTFFHLCKVDVFDFSPILPSCIVKF